MAHAAESCDGDTLDLHTCLDDDVRRHTRGVDHTRAQLLLCAAVTAHACGVHAHIHGREAVSVQVTGTHTPTVSLHAALHEGARNTQVRRWLDRGHAVEITDTGVRLPPVLVQDIHPWDLRLGLDARWTRLRRSQLRARRARDRVERAAQRDPWAGVAAFFARYPHVQQITYSAHREGMWAPASLPEREDATYVQQTQHLRLRCMQLPAHVVAHAHGGHDLHVTRDGDVTLYAAPARN